MSSSRVVRVHARDEVAAQSLRDGIAQIQSELKVTPDFAPEVEEAATRAAADPRLPDLDRTDLPFVTIDPAVVDGSRPGAPHRARGHRLRRALRDRRRRGVRRSRVTRSTSPPTSAARRCTARTPRSRCIPTSLSEGAASLLPDQVRPALLWTIHVDDTGEGTDVHVERARVRLDGQARLRGRAAGGRRRHGRRGADAAQGGRRAPAPARGRARRHLAPAARAGGRGDAATTGRWSSAR